MKRLHHDHITKHARSNDSAGTYASSWPCTRQEDCTADGCHCGPEPACIPGSALPTTSGERLSGAQCRRQRIVLCRDTASLQANAAALCLWSAALKQGASVSQQPSSKAHQSHSSKAGWEGPAASCWQSNKCLSDQLCAQGAEDVHCQRITAWLQLVRGPLHDLGFCC